MPPGEYADSFAAAQAYGELLATQSALMLRNGVAFSQPYYSRHPWVHLQRGETKALRGKVRD